MTLPRLYKYLDVSGATKTLGNRTFRHARPSSYKDLEDMTIRSVFPDEIETALAKLSDGWVDVLLDNHGKTPTCSPKLAETVAELQAILSRNPDEAARLRVEFKKLFDSEWMRTRSQAFVEDTNDYMQTYRILCVTTDNASERMWES
jgi:hypothetical protein